MGYPASRAWRLAAVLAAALAMPGQSAFAEDLRIGMSSALSGPAEALGQGVKAGVEAHFAEVNAAGGIDGRRLALVSLDDGYEPKRAAPNMHALIDQHQVLAVIGNVGTPTAIVTVPIANRNRTLLFGAYTGAGVLRRTPPDRYVINYRASYAEETAAMIDGLLSQGVRAEEIAFFTQNDGYGDAGYQGAITALKARGYADAGRLAHGRYMRNTLNVEDGLATIIDAPVPPRAVIMVGAYKPCAAFIRLARELMPGTIYLNVSFVGSVPLARELGDQAEGVIVTQVVPHFDSALPGVADYRKAMQAAGVEPGFTSLEGYVAARIFVAGLRRAGPDVDRERLVDALESLRGFDTGLGFAVDYGPNEHQASHRVWPTVIRKGVYVPLDWSELRL